MSALTIKKLDSVPEVFSPNTLYLIKPIGSTTVSVMVSNNDGSEAYGLEGLTGTEFYVTGTSPVISPNNGTSQLWSLTGNSQPTAGVWENAQTMQLAVDDGDGYWVDWSGMDVEWKTESGLPPTLNSTGYTFIRFWKAAGTLYGERVGNA